MIAVVTTRDDQPEHGGKYLRRLRLSAGMTTAEVAVRAGMTPSELEEIELIGTAALSYNRITALVRATQPERPSWWDDGHEHDLSLLHAHLPPRTPQEIRYWRRIQHVRDVIDIKRQWGRERAEKA